MDEWQRDAQGRAGGNGADNQQPPEADLAERDSEARRQDQAADFEDDQAVAADRTAGVRDQAAEARDASADDREDQAAGSTVVPTFSADRRRARADREAAALDRADANADRARSQRLREGSRRGRERASHDRGSAWDALIRLREFFSASVAPGLERKPVTDRPDAQMLGRNRFADDLAQRRRAAQVDDAVAATRDEEGTAADTAAAARDRAALQRDVAADSDMEDSPSTTAGRRAQLDRAGAALDRRRAADDRGRARADRDTARHGRDRAFDDQSAAVNAVAHVRALLDRAENNPDDMVLIGEAQGRLMKAHGVGEAEALLEMMKRAARDEKDLEYAARGIVTEQAG